MYRTITYGEFKKLMEEKGASDDFEMFVVDEEFGEDTYITKDRVIVDNKSKTIRFNG